MVIIVTDEPKPVGGHTKNWGQWHGLRLLCPGDLEKFE